MFSLFSNFKYLHLKKYTFIIFKIFKAQLEHGSMNFAKMSSVYKGNKMFNSGKRMKIMKQFITLLIIVQIILVVVNIAI